MGGPRGGLRVRRKQPGEALQGRGNLLPAAGQPCLKQRRPRGGDLVQSGLRGGVQDPPGAFRIPGVQEQIGEQEPGGVEGRGRLQSCFQGFPAIPRIGCGEGAGELPQGFEIGGGKGPPPHAELLTQPARHIEEIFGRRAPCQPPHDARSPHVLDVEAVGEAARAPEKAAMDSTLGPAVDGFGITGRREDETALVPVRLGGDHGRQRRADPVECGIAGQVFRRNHGDARHARPGWRDARAER